MTQIERIKPLTQKRVEQFLLRVHLEPKEIPLHKTCVRFTEKSGVIPKICNSLNNRIMKTGHQWVEKMQ